MKDQYVGDVGDFGKYGLLRFLIGEGFDLGVNWYHTKNLPNSNDGNVRKYIDRPELFSDFDPELFRLMENLQSEDERCIKYVEIRKVLPGTTFFGDVLDTEKMIKWDKLLTRRRWHERALGKLAGCELIFADPDNGLSTDMDEKYVLPSEIEDYFSRGQDVIYYHHRDYSSEERWLRTVSFMREYLDGAEALVLTFHPWVSRAYVFVVHEDRAKRYQDAIDKFLVSRWGTVKINGKPVFDQLKLDKGACIREYTLEYLLECKKNTKKNDFGEYDIRHDDSMGKWRMRIPLEKTKYWFLSVFIGDDGVLDKYSLDYEGASDSHYEFNISLKEASEVFREYIGKGPCYLDEALARYVSDHDGSILQEKLLPYIGASYSY